MCFRLHEPAPVFCFHHGAESNALLITQRTIFRRAREAPLAHPIRAGEVVKRAAALLTRLADHRPEFLRERFWDIVCLLATTGHGLPRTLRTRTTYPPRRAALAQGLW